VIENKGKSEPRFRLSVKKNAINGIFRGPHLDTPPQFPGRKPKERKTFAGQSRASSGSKRDSEQQAGNDH
jgi:hypothetical protein